MVLKSYISLTGSNWLKLELYNCMHDLLGIAFGRRYFHQ